MSHFLCVMDEFGSPVLRYVYLPDGYYFGGNTHPGVDLDCGPHITHHAGSMLDLIARLANAKDQRYDVQGTYTKNGIRYGHSVRLQPEMMADDVAKVLDIDPQEVVKRYGLLVRVPEPEEAA